MAGLLTILFYRAIHNYLVFRPLFERLSQRISQMASDSCKIPTDLQSFGRGQYKIIYFSKSLLLFPPFTGGVEIVIRI